MNLILLYIESILIGWIIGGKFWAVVFLAITNGLYLVASFLEGARDQRREQPRP